MEEKKVGRSGRVEEVDDDEGDMQEETCSKCGANG